MFCQSKMAVDDTASSHFASSTARDSGVQDILYPQWCSGPLKVHFWILLPSLELVKQHREWEGNRGWGNRLGNGERGTDGAGRRMVRDWEGDSVSDSPATDILFPVPALIQLLGSNQTCSAIYFWEGPHSQKLSCRMQHEPLWHCCIATRGVK